MPGSCVVLMRDDGVTGEALSWFRTYLEERTQRIQIDSETSDDIPLQLRVPQGSRVFYPCIPGNREWAVERLTACVKELRQWIVACWLKLNDDKTEMIMFMSKYHLNRYGQCTINIGDSTITPSHHVRNLGVQVDQHLSMVPHVTAICASCNYHLYRLSSIQRYLTVNATRTVVQALITSRLDCCNSVMINIPSKQMERLQKI